MRFGGALIALSFLLAGCAVFVDDELQGDVEAMAPSGSTTISCNAEKNWGSGDVKSMYHCVYGAPGSLAQVGTEILLSAGGEGFTLTCDGGRHKLVLIGASGKKLVSIDVLEQGFVTAQNIAAGTPIPAGQVLVDITLVKLDEPPVPGGNRCVPSGRLRP